MTDPTYDFLREQLLDQRAREDRLIKNEQEFRRTMGDENYEKDIEYQAQWIKCIKHLQEQYRKNYRKYNQQ